MTMNGYDGMLFGGLTANSQFLDFFHGSAAGEWYDLNLKNSAAVRDVC